MKGEEIKSSNVMGRDFHLTLTGQEKEWPTRNHMVFRAQSKTQLETDPPAGLCSGLSVPVPKFTGEVSVKAFG